MASVCTGLALISYLVRFTVNILVFLKQVPDTEAAIRIAADQKSIEEAGVKFIINPYDEYALEEAIRIKEKAGNAKVHAICIGPERAKEALRTALAMGADEALLLKTTQPGYDGLAVAQKLAEVAARDHYDLILLGKETIDDGNSDLGPMIAAKLQQPCVTLAIKLTLQESEVIVEREGDAGIELLTVQSPAVITCQKGLNEPRYPSIRGVMMAKKKEIPEEAIDVQDAQVQLLRLAAPAGRKAGRLVGEGAAAVPELVKLLREEAKVL
jgi:electron transfer flavoprotein beta subunit